LLIRTESAWTELAVKSEVIKAKASNALVARRRRGVFLTVLKGDEFILFTNRRVLMTRRLQHFQFAFSSLVLTRLE
jgi:hypothetical protein